MNAGFAYLFKRGPEQKLSSVEQDMIELKKGWGI